MKENGKSPQRADPRPCLDRCGGGSKGRGACSVFDVGNQVEGVRFDYDDISFLAIHGNRRCNDPEKPLSGPLGFSRWTYMIGGQEEGGQEGGQEVGRKRGQGGSGKGGKGAQGGPEARGG